MGRKTKIDWCDSSWNPVTGCLHGCEYCYARGIAHRFGGFIKDQDTVAEKWVQRDNGKPLVVEIAAPQVRKDLCGRLIAAPYPYRFMPTLYRYKLDEPKFWKHPRSIFVCSMADLFGEWVPDSWIRAVMDACYAAPQHRYLFLTKNPERYGDAIEYLETDVKNGPGDEPPEMWFGTSATTNEQLERAYGSLATWISIEPILEHIDTDMYFGDVRNYGNGEHELKRWKWVVIGAETGSSRKNKVLPEKEWVMEIVEECKEWKTPVFMKESLRELMGDDFRQEFPWR